MGEKSERELFKNHQTIANSGNEHEREPYENEFSWKRHFERDYANDLIRTKPSLINRKANLGKKATK